MSNKTEILGFEDSWKKNRHVFGSTKSLAKVMYLDGQQSKQDEIDGLQKNFNNALKTVNIQQQFLDDADGTIKIITSQVDGLQKRVDELERFVKSVINWDAHPKDWELNSGSWGVRDFYRNYAIRILKGEDTK